MVRSLLYLVGIINAMSDRANACIRVLSIDNVGAVNQSCKRALISSIGSEFKSWSTEDAMVLYI